MATAAATALATAAATEVATGAVDTSALNFSLFAIFELGVGLYFAYLAIMGKGNAFKFPYVKDGMEKTYAKGLRLFYALLSPLLLAVGGLEFADFESRGTLQLIIWGVIMLVMIGVFIFSYKMTDKTKKEIIKEKGAVKKPLPPSTWGDPDPEDYIKPMTGADKRDERDGK
ncbi:hypothetical protein SDC9_166978 [bioreactor metagenome]|uniref:Uncharacterized protein n=1 Tax=bioreactor metagenome TaxID=1076179 RepID=A0A645G0D0_9ZZZZ